MCNFKSANYTLSDWEAYVKFRASEEIARAIKPTFYENGFDHKTSLIITAPGAVGLFSWGLIPWFTKSYEQALMIRNQTLNAISEEMYDKPSFRDSLKANRRCLIPVTGFFEWQWNDLKGKTKQPYFIHVPKQKIFSLAGIWSEWHDKENDKDVYTYSILTCPANSLMEKINNNKKRMPVIIPDQYMNDWLNPNLSKDDVFAFCQPFDQTLMDAYPIDRKIGSTKIRSEEKNVPDILTKVEPVEPTIVEPKPKKLKGDPGQRSLF